jgi:DNA-binding NtrC family response regulator
MEYGHDHPTRHILVVDDELGILHAVERELKGRSLGRYAFNVAGFTDPRQALAAAERQTFDAVISDFRMPGMDGLEFLKALAIIQPDCPRLVLSGQTDMDSLVRMVNETHIYRFIAKPWPAYMLQAALTQAIDYAETLAENRRLAEAARQRQLSELLPEPAAVEQLLIVDDDMGVLNSLARVLTHHSKSDGLFAAILAEQHGQPRRQTLAEDRISVQITPSPAYALQMAERVAFSCIIADYRMPEMNGVELLQRFAARQPDCSRILISGQIGETELAQAIQQAHIFAFVEKPWSDFELKANIALALAQHRLQLENRWLAAFMRPEAEPAASGAFPG